MLVQQEIEILFVHRMLNNKTQSTFPLHGVGFRLVIPQVFNLQKWISILGLFLLKSTPEIKVKEYATTGILSSLEWGDFPNMIS